MASQLQRSAVKALARNSALKRAVIRPVVASRDVSTQSMTPEESLEMLNKQRNTRPNSPWHIYKPQLTSVSSIANRATGVGLSVGIYGIFLSHLLGIDSATLISAFGSLPEWLKLSAKSILALPFTYHTLNGIRHLSWDQGYLLDLATSYKAGWTVVASSVISAFGLVYFF